jgi:hypothetical protein
VINWQLHAYAYSLTLQAVDEDGDDNEQESDEESSESSNDSEPEENVDAQKKGRILKAFVDSDDEEQQQPLINDNDETDSLNNSTNTVIPNLDKSANFNSQASKCGLLKKNPMYGDFINLFSQPISHSMSQASQKTSFHRELQSLLIPRRVRWTMKIY